MKSQKLKRSTETSDLKKRLAWSRLFEKHCHEFLCSVISEKKLKKNHHIIAVSGGIDSMSLLFLANSFFQRKWIAPVRALFIHHGTRSGQDDDEQMVKRFCEQYNIPLSVIYLQGLDGERGNFEEKARNLRRKVYQAELKENEFLWTGHQLDDSFEWSLMQRLRSSHLKSALGIPVKNKRIIRPFLAVTKKQIRKYSQFNKIPYRDDPTNFETRYDRNYLRLNVISSIAKRYPSYLKFYAHHANQLALLLKVHILKKEEQQRTFEKIFLIGPKEPFQSQSVLIDETLNEEKIFKIIHYLSSKKRGELRTAVKRMLMAIRNKKKGPFFLSGGVQAYFSSDSLIFYDKKMEKKRRLLDQNIAENMKQLDRDGLMCFPKLTFDELNQSWESLLTRSDAIENMPALALILENPSMCKTFNTGVYEQLFPEVSKTCRNFEFRMTTIPKYLRIWSKKQKKLPRELKIIPLFHLSHLFTSQQG